MQTANQIAANIRAAARSAMSLTRSEYVTDDERHRLRLAAADLDGFSIDVATGTVSRRAGLRTVERYLRDRLSADIARDLMYEVDPPAEDAGDPPLGLDAPFAPGVPAEEGACDICGERADAEMGEFWDAEADASLVAHVTCGLGHNLPLA